MCRTARRAELAINSSQKLRLRCNSRRERANHRSRSLRAISRLIRWVQKDMVLAAIHENLKVRDLIARSLELPKRSDYFDFHPGILSKTSTTDDSFESNLYCALISVISYLFLSTVLVKLVNIICLNQLNNINFISIHLFFRLLKQNLIYYCTNILLINFIFIN